MKPHAGISVAFAWIVAHNFVFATVPNNHVSLVEIPQSALGLSDVLPLSSIEVEQPRHNRELAVDSFYDLETVYQSASIEDSPNRTLTGSVGGNNWTVDITYVSCQNLTIDNLELSYDLASPELLFMNLTSKQFGFTCVMDYNFRYQSFNKTGRVDSTTDNAFALLTSAFLSDNFTMYGPNQGFGVISCNALVEFSALNFSGQGIGNISALQNATETSLIEFITLESEQFVCEALNTTNFTILELLLNVSSFLGADSPDLNTSIVESIVEAEASLTNSSNSTFLSFSDPKGILADVVAYLVKEATSYLGENANATDLNINDLMRSSVLEDDRSLLLNASFFYEVFAGEFTNGDGPFADTFIIPQIMLVYGLDSFTSFSPLQPIANHTLQANFSLEALSMLVGMVWALPDGSVENITLQVDFTKIDATIDVLIAIDEGVLGNLTMGSLLNSSLLLNCMLSTISDLQIINLGIEVGAIGPPKVGGFENSPGSRFIASNFTSAVYEMFQTVLVAELPGFLQTTGRELLMNLTMDYLSNSECPNVIGSSSGSGLVDLRDFFLSADKAVALGGTGSSPLGNVARAVKGIIDSLLVESVEGLPGINDFLIGPLTKDQSGVEGTFSNLVKVNQYLDLENSLSARIRLIVSDVDIKDLVVGEPFVLLDPVLNEPHLLNNTVTIGLNDSTPAQVSANVFFHWDGDGTSFGIVHCSPTELTMINTISLCVHTDGLQVNDNLTVGINLYRANLLAEVVLQLVEERLSVFPLKDAFNLQCWLATLSTPTLDARGVRASKSNITAGLRSLNVTADFATFNLTCISCTKQSAFEALQDIFDSPSGSQDAYNAANKLVQFVVRTANSGVLQLYLDRMMAKSGRKCPHSPSYNVKSTAAAYKPVADSGNSDSIRFLIALLVITICLILVAIVVSIMVRFVVRRRYSKWLETLPPNQLLLVYRQQSLERRKTARMNEVAPSMFQSTEISVFARYGIPVVALLTLGLFLSGHLNVAGSVQIRAQVAAQEIRVEDFYRFSVILSARDLWNSGGRLPAAMIFLFSVIWPYTKQLMTLALWFAPPSTVSLPIRGFLFQMLDLLAKWSVIDIFFFIFALVAFRVTIKSPNVSYLPPGFYSAELYLIPFWGLYANLIAQLVSQVSAHFILNYHRRAVRSARNEVNRLEQQENVDKLSEPTTQVASSSAGDNPEKLCDFGYKSSNEGNSGTFKVKGWVPFIVIVLAVGLCAAVIAGCILPSFSFATQGLVNVVIEAGHGFRTVVIDRSIFSMARLLIQQAKFLATAKTRVGLGSLAVLLVLNTLIVPLIHIVLIVAQFVLPLSPKAHSNLEVALEISQDWQYLDVYVISIIISLSQLGTFSESLVNPFCKGINGLLSDMAYFDVIEKSDAQCYRVQSAIESGGYVLLGAAAVTALLYTFVTKAYAQYRRNQIDAEEANSRARLLSNAAAETDDVNRARQLIQPPPVSFTDTFSWFLYPDVTHAAAAAAAAATTTTAADAEADAAAAVEGDVPVKDVPDESEYDSPAVEKMPDNAEVGDTNAELVTDVRNDSNDDDDVDVDEVKPLTERLEQ